MDLIISSPTQRSGSTLLQRIFNVRKKTLIWGEHNGILTDFHNIYLKTTTFYQTHRGYRERYFKNGENANTWIACLMPDRKFIDDSIIASIRAYFDSLYAERSSHYDLIGFKEVKYGRKELELFRKCYPKTPIVLLVRNPIDVRKSMNGTKWGKAENPINQFMQQWSENAKYYYELSMKDRNAYLIKYEDLINQNSNTLKIIRKLGQLNIPQFSSVLSTKVNSSSSTIPPNEKSKIIHHCGSVMKLYGYL